MTNSDIFDIAKMIGAPGGMILALIFAIRWLLGQFEAQQIRFDTVVAKYEVRLEEHAKELTASLQANSSALTRIAEVLARCPVNGLSSQERRELLKSVAEK